ILTQAYTLKKREKRGTKTEIVDMGHFLDINNNDKPNGLEVREDEFWQQL
ncbi:28885_t:CDS:1, partial [Gigaspora margarita]